MQHIFGESGFGLAANYTLVESGLTYDNQNRGEQFALEGLSDAANVVAFFEKYGWTVRAAYNWRDEFLDERFDGTGLPNPQYTEEYGQLDLNVAYQWNDSLILQAEAINLTDEIQRIHGRSDTQLLFVTQTGPRYMIEPATSSDSSGKATSALATHPRGCGAEKAAGDQRLFHFSLR